MPWSTPLTAVANAALTAAQWNASVRDNLLETAPAKATTASAIFVTTGANSIAQRIPASDVVGSTQTTTSTTYVDLATIGPQVTVTTGGSALVMFGGFVTVDTAGARALMGYAVSGSTTVAATDANALAHDVSSTGRIIGATRTIMQTVAAGSNTFKCQYKVGGGTGTFAQRNIVVIPL